MTIQVGATIVGVLEQAARRHLDPEAYGAFLFQLGGSGALDRYDASEAYWDRVQAILDGFFGAAERAAICGLLITDDRLRRRPEFQGFLVRGLAERQVQGLARVALLPERACQPRWHGRSA